MTTTLTALSLGSNLGDREFYITAMERELQAALTDVRTSPLMETAPVGVPDAQPPYLNKIVVGRYGGTPLELLDVCFAIEAKLGRTRETPKGVRTADVDILLFGVESIKCERLVIPHPGLFGRRFCLEGLMAIDPYMVIDHDCDGVERRVIDEYKNMSSDVACQNVSFI